MAERKDIVLLRQNLKKVEEKHEDFFVKGVPRWPGEKRDYLRNHHKNLDNLSMTTLRFDDLNITDLPADIVQDLETAFEAFRNGRDYK